MVYQQIYFIYEFFYCAVYVPIAPLQRNKIGLQRRIEIYIGFDSPSIIRYLEPLTGDVFKARFEDCHFDENIFSSLVRIRPSAYHNYFHFQLVYGIPPNLFHL